MTVMDGHTLKVLNEICVDLDVCTVDAIDSLEDIMRRFNSRMDINSEMIVDSCIEAVKRNEPIKVNSVKYHAERIMELRQGRDRVKKIFEYLSE